jgi:hypothetical protein
MAAGMKPDTGLTDEQKKLWRAVEDCQSTVTVYVDSRYEKQVDVRKYGRPEIPFQHVRRIGAYNKFEKYFADERASHDRPNAILADQELIELQKKVMFEGNRDPNDQGTTYSKYRVIVSEVPFINSDGSISKIKMMTACPPDLSGSRSDLDLDRFIKKGHLDEKEYEKACYEMADLMAIAAKDRNLNPVKIPGFDFGWGGNSKLTVPEEKARAQEIMSRALKASAEKHQVKFDIVLNSQEDVNNLNKVFFKSNFIKAESGDLLKDVPKWADQNAAIFNTGNARNVGAHAISVEPGTQEGELAHNALFTFTQTTLNPQFTKKVSIVNIAEAKVEYTKEIPSERQVETAKLADIKPAKEKSKNIPLQPIEKPENVPLKPIEKAKNVPLKPIEKPESVPLKPIEKPKNIPLQPIEKPSSHKTIAEMMKIKPAQAKGFSENSKLLQTMFGLHAHQLERRHDKNGNELIKVNFESYKRTEKFSGDLSGKYNITSNSHPGDSKRTKHKAVFLTDKDLNQLREASMLSQKTQETEQKTAAPSQQLPDSVKIRSSVNKKTGEAQVSIAFKSNKELRAFTRGLAEKGVDYEVFQGMQRMHQAHEVTLAKNDFNELPLMKEQAMRQRGPAR